MQTTYVPKKDEIRSQWFLIDASDVVLGRLCSEIAQRLMGKTKPQYAPFIDTGDHVVVINAARVKLTGRKLDDKLYIHHTGYPGGIKSRTASEVKARTPEKLVLEGVRGMLPKTILGRKMIGKLRVYAGPEHPHEAQQPVPLQLASSR